MLWLKWEKINNIIYPAMENITYPKDRKSTRLSPARCVYAPAQILLHFAFVIHHRYSEENRTDRYQIGEERNFMRDKDKEYLIKKR